MLVGIYNLSVRIFWSAEFLTSYGSERWESPWEDDSPEIRHILVIQTQKALAGEFCTVSGQFADVVLSVGVCLAEVSQHINLQKVVNEFTLPTSWTMIKRNRFTEMAEN